MLSTSGFLGEAGRLLRHCGFGHLKNHKGRFVGIPLAMITGALLGALASFFTFFLLAKRYKIAARIELGEKLLQNLHSSHDKEAELLVETNTLLGKQEDTLNESRERQARLEDLLVRAEQALSKGRDIWGGLENRHALLDDREKQVDRWEEELRDQEQLIRQRRSEISAWSEEQAREAWLEELSALSSDKEQELLTFDRQRLEKSRDEEARNILITVLQRQAVEQGLERCVDYVELPGETYKMRLIGREGRNSRAFQRAAGVNLLIDDTPGIVVVSCFDPLRRAIACRALNQLFQGGAIHPGRIEEQVSQARKDLDKEILNKGSEVCRTMEIADVSEAMLIVLGRLQFCQSYGQNLLQHSLEVAALSAGLAAELGLDPQLARRCGLLHDIGRALQHEVDLKHEEAGARFAERCGESDLVQQVIAGHHALEFEDSYTKIVQIADRISSERSGARSLVVHEHIQRLAEMESIASAHASVESAYVFNAGRELWVFVKAEEVSARAAMKLSREITKELETRVRHPGTVEVTLIRNALLKEKVG
jgi:ribonucrease Y